LLGAGGAPEQSSTPDAEHSNFGAAAVALGNERAALWNRRSETLAFAA